MRCSAAPRRCSCRQGASPSRFRAPIIEDSDPRRRLALIAARFFGAQPETAVAVTGTNGKTSVASFVRQLWAGAGIRRGEPRHGRRGQPVRHQDAATTRRPIRSSCTASSPRSPRRASRILRSKRRATACNSAASMASGSRPAPSPTFRAIIWTITRASRTISRRSSGCSPSFCRKALPPSSMSTAKPGRRVAADSGGAAGSISSRSDAAERRCGSSLPSATASRQRLVVEHDGKRHRCVCRWSAPSRPRMRWSLPVSPWRPERAPRPCCRCSPTLRGARGRLDLAGTARGGAPIFIDYAHTPDALAKALDALASLCREPAASSCSAAAATATRASGPRWAKVAVAQGRSRHRHRRQSAQRKPRRDQRARSCGRARRRRDRRPRGGDRRGDRRARARRCPAGRRQGPRDRPDRGYDK